MKKRILHSICFLFAVSSLLAQTRNISGTVTNAVGDVLTGATVVVKGTIIGTSTDEAGLFRLDVPEGYTLLAVSYLGYADQEVQINEQDIVNVMLEESASALDEVIVVGFGTRSKRLITGAVSSVGEEVFEGVAVSDFQNALTARMPGVVMTGSSGMTNSEVGIRIRGVGSISAGNQPLIVIDGLILNERNAAPYNENQYRAFAINPFININPNDIASVEVLKDAASSAIYGSRGSNGVILITTKSGQFNTKPKVNIGYYAGFSDPVGTLDVMDGKEYATLWNQSAAYIYDPQVNPELFYDVESQPSTDWQQLGLQKGFVQEMSASVAGGTSTTKYYIGGSAKDEDSYLLTGNFKRYGFRATIDQLIGEKWTTGITISPSFVRNNRPNYYDSPFYWTDQWPNVEAFDENGDPIKGPIYTSIGTTYGYSSSLIDVYDVWNRITSTQLLSSAYLSYSPIPELSFKTGFSSELTNLEELYKYGEEHWLATPLGYASSYNQQVINYNWTVLASYKNSFNNRHDIDASIGANMTRESLGGQYFDGNSFPNDQLLYLGAAANITSNITTQTDAGFLGYLARVNYTFENKYLATVSARYDGSSRFGKANRYGFFPAISAGWILTEEAFFDMKFIDFLKLRSSFGIAGNAQINDFASKGLVRFGQNYIGNPGFDLLSIENEELAWEKNVQWDIGLEFACWDNRIRGTLGYYIKDTKDLLLEVPIPRTNGFTTIYQNVGEVRNQGFEFDLSVDVLKGPFKWTIQANGATLKNEVLKTVDNNGDGKEDDIFIYDRWLFRTGESVGTFFLPEYAGVDPENGDALFWNAEKTEKLPNYVSDSNRRIVGKALPDFTGGFSSSFQFKNFDLSAFFQVKTGFQVYRQWAHIIETNMQGSGNQARSQLDAWTPENRDTDVPQARLYTQNGAQRWTSRRLSDGDFLRLKNLQLGYTFKDIGSWKNTIRVFAAAQNLLTFTDFPDPDPDAGDLNPNGAVQGSNLANQPGTRMITFGFNVSL